MTDLSPPDRLPHELEPAGAVQGDLFAMAGKGTATLLRTLPQDEGRIYDLTPPLDGRWSRVLITNGSISHYVRAWGNPGAGPYVTDPIRDAEDDAAALDKLGYEIGNPL